MKTQGTKINLSCRKSYFNLCGSSRCCYRKMLRIIVWWKVISCCVIHKFLQNTDELFKKHHITSHML